MTEDFTLLMIPVETLPDWAKWKGVGPMPASWFVTKPDDGKTVKVYRSYEDYSQ